MEDISTTVLVVQFIIGGIIGLTTGSYEVIIRRLRKIDADVQKIKDTIGEPSSVLKKNSNIEGPTGDLVKLVGGVQRAAALANVSAPSVSRWQTATTPDVIPVSAIIALEKEAEAPLVTAVLADLSDRALVEGVQETDGCIMAQHADFAEQVSETLSSATRALSDLRVTPAEATAVVKELRDLIATAKAQIRTLSSIAASGETWKVEVR